MISENRKEGETVSLAMKEYGFFMYAWNQPTQVKTAVCYFLLKNDAFSLIAISNFNVMAKSVSPSF